MRSTNGEIARKSLPGDRRTIPAELYHALMDLPPEDRFDREKVNEGAQQRQQSVWIYEDGHKRAGDGDWKEAASAWLAENDPEGVAWAYPIERERR
jgi:hypothetical protein